MSSCSCIPSHVARSGHAHLKTFKEWRQANSNTLSPSTDTFGFVVAMKPYGGFINGLVHPKNENSGCFFALMPFQLRMTFFPQEGRIL